MATPQNQSNQGQQRDQENLANFPSGAANDKGQLLNEADSSSIELDETSNNEDAAQHSCAGSRIDDLGINDLSDENLDIGELHKNLSTLHELDQKDLPLFDQSLQGIDPDGPNSNPQTPDSMGASETSSDDADDESKDLSIYETSLNGSGTDDRGQLSHEEQK